MPRSVPFKRNALERLASRLLAPAHSANLEMRNFAATRDASGLVTHTHRLARHDKANCGCAA